MPTPLIGLPEPPIRIALGAQPPLAGRAARNAARIRWTPPSQIDELILPLSALPNARLNEEVGERLRQIAPVRRCLCVITDHGCAGLDTLAPRLHGTLPAELLELYAALIFERDPLLACAAREGRALLGTIEEYCA